MLLLPSVFKIFIKFRSPKYGPAYALPDRGSAQKRKQLLIHQVGLHDLVLAS